MRLFSRTTLALGLLLAVAASAPLEARQAKIHETLDRILTSSAEDELVRVYVLLDEQVDRRRVADAVRGMRRSARRAHAIAAMRSVAERTQAPVLDLLSEQKALGEVGDVTPLWIANVLIVEATPGVVEQLADHAAVRYLHWVRPYAPGEATDARYGAAAADGADGPDALINLELLNAPALWAMGYEGQSVVVGNIDTGTDYLHSDLNTHVWTNLYELANGIDDDGNGFIDDFYGWNFESNNNDPRGSNFDSHGTNTAGIIAGDGTGGTRTGVAARAVVMALKACGEDYAMQAFQYAVANGADIMTSSCSYKFPNEPAYAVWREITENEYLAGVMHSNSIGNQGRSLGSYPIPYNISAPGNGPSSWLHPDQVILGGLGSLMATGGVETDLRLYADSGRGPAAWEDIQASYPGQRPIPPEYWDYPWSNGTQQGLLKPDVVMPTNVRTIDFGSGYLSSFGGTSAATPHTAGAMALLISTAPNVTAEQISEALQSTAMDLGDPGKDNEFGAGLVDVDAAARSVWPDVTPVMEPWGQLVQPGDTIDVALTLINNTSSPQTVLATLRAFDAAGNEIPGSPVVADREFLVPVGAPVTGRFLRTAPAAGGPRGPVTLELSITTTSGEFIASRDVLLAFPL